MRPLLTACASLVPLFCCAADRVPASPPPAVSAAVVATLLARDLVGMPDKEVVMLTVQYPAAGSSLPHRHNAQVCVFVLEGEVTMQVRGSAAVTLHPGEVFYEGPEDVHVVSANDSQSAPAKLLVFMIKDKGVPAARPAD